MPDQKPSPSPDTERGEVAPAAPRFAPLFFVCAALIVTLVYYTYESELHHDPSLWKTAGKVFWKNASVRPPLLLVVIVAGWAWVIRMCRSSALNLELVLKDASGFSAFQSVASTYHAALTMFTLLLLFRLVHFVASEMPGQV